MSGECLRFFSSFHSLACGCALGRFFPLNFSVVRWNLFDLKYNDIYCGGDIRSNQEPRPSRRHEKKGITSLSCSSSYVGVGILHWNDYIEPTYVQQRVSEWLLNARLHV